MLNRYATTAALDIIYTGLENDDFITFWKVLTWGILFAMGKNSNIVARWILIKSSGAQEPVG